MAVREFSRIHVLAAAIACMGFGVPAAAPNESPFAGTETSRLGEGTGDNVPNSPFRSEALPAPDSVAAGQVTELHFVLRIPPEHYAYAERCTLVLLPDPGLEYVDLREPQPEKKMDPFLEEEVDVHKHDATFVARVRATKVGADTARAQIAELVARAQAGKAPIQRLVDRVSAIFVPAVLVLALGTLVAWLVATGDAADAFTAAVAVLIIACPCALGLATPTALIVGTGRGAQLGIFIKGPEVLEQTRRITTVLLDKTGTVTEGTMQVIDARPGGRSIRPTGPPESRRRTRAIPTRRTEAGGSSPAA